MVRGRSLCRRDGLMERVIVRAGGGITAVWNFQELRFGWAVLLIIVAWNRDDGSAGYFGTTG